MKTFAELTPPLPSLGRASPSACALSVSHVADVLGTAHFSKAGRELARWHPNYETVDIYPDALLDCSGGRSYRTGELPDGCLRHLIPAPDSE